MDPERERKAHEFAIRRSDELAARWEAEEMSLRRRVSPPAEASDPSLAPSFVEVIRQRIDAVIEGYLKHAIDEPYTKYDREFLARKATEEAERVIEHVRERFGQRVADEHRISLESHAVDALKNHLDPV
jgi:hypothetical protein